MKIRHLINTLSTGGAAPHLVTLCNHVQQLGVEDVVAMLREKVAANRSLRSDLESAGIGVIGLGVYSRFSLRFPALVRRVVKSESLDILHSHLFRADLGASAITPSNRSTPH